VTFVGESVGTQALLNAGVKVEYLEGFQERALALNEALLRE
jgi:hypothetical protein